MTTFLNWLRGRFCWALGHEAETWYWHARKEFPCYVCKYCSCNLGLWLYHFAWPDPPMPLPRPINYDADGDCGCLPDGECQ